MRLELPREADRLGAVILYGVQKVYELDAGLRSEKARSAENPLIWRISYETRQQIDRRMAIVVPVRKERLRLIEGVLCGIPHDCLTLVVSNSPREPVDRYQMEKGVVERLSRFIDKPIVIVHQKDPALAAAFAGAGYPELLGEDGLVKDGKALMHNTETLAEDRASLLLQAGKGGVPAGGWPDGRYHAALKITRDGKPLIEQATDPIPFE